MVRLLQHSAGPGSQGRRMDIGVIIWFIITGLVRGSLSSVVDEGKSTLQNSTKRIFQDTTLYKENEESSFNKDANSASLLHRSSRELPQTKNGNEFSFDSAMEAEGISEAIQKLPVKSKSFYVIPYFRPGRSNNKNKHNGNFGTTNTMIPMARFGRSELDLVSSGSNSENGLSSLKRHETVIPTMRFGKRQSSNYDSVIPYPRLGRSSETEIESESASDVDGNADDDYVKTSFGEDGGTDESEMHDYSFYSEKIQKKDDYDTIIPYPRTGRYAYDDTNMFQNEGKREDSDYVLPQIRYGRSVVLLSSPKTDENTKQNPHTFVLPYPRPGRSSKYPEKTEYSKNLQVILPYPRPGRSKLNSDEESLNFEKRQNSYMLPFARLGRSSLKMPFQSKENLNNDDIYSDLPIDHFPLKSDQKSYAEKLKDTTELNSVFMIPYPRPGKKSLLALTGSQGKQKQNNEGKEISDYVLPYPRPGKKSSIMSSNMFGKDNNEPLFALDQDRDDDMDSDYSTSDFESFITEAGFTDLHNGDSSHLRNKRSNSVLPYPRLGRSDMVIPYPRLGRSDMVIPYPRLGRSEMVIPYPRLGRSNSVVPYPRPGRSNFVIPHPRLGRSNSVVPYPRPGRSNSVIPYPRLGRSNSVVPYPRLGRSNSVVPYPRLGRSNSVVPYPRLGRSDSIVPYPRPGRSDSVVPYPRPGRSDTVVPYPRPGRSGSTVPYLRSSRSTSVLPYPRPGRSNSVVPYPRPGKSESVFVFPRLRKSLSVVPYPRLGRSSKEGSISGSKYEVKPGNWILPNIRPGRSNFFKGESDIIPYPRPGRSQNDLLQNEDLGYSFVAKRQGEDMIIPYPRPGRSINYGQGYVVPYPRFGRSKDSVKGMDEITNSNTIIPYPRVGRSQEQVTSSPEIISTPHKLNKHMLTRVDESIYILPYPRPGRYSE